MRRAILIVAAAFVTRVVFGLDGEGTFESPYSGNITSNYSFGPGTVYIGGDIYVQAGTLTIQPGTTLRIYDGKNITVQNSGNVYAVGESTLRIYFTADNNNWGHVYLYGSSNSDFDYCNFEMGKTDGMGGALYVYICSDVQITNSIFRNNEAYDGGAVNIENSNVHVSDCIFENNVATYRGGAIFLTGSTYTPIIERCKISGNTGNNWTGGIHCFSNAKGTIQNCLIYNNKNGGFNWGGSTTEGEIVFSVINCVIANNTENDIVFRTSENISVRNSIIWGLPGSVYYGYGDVPKSYNLINCAAQGVLLGSTAQVIENVFINSFTLNSLNNDANGPNFLSPLTDYNITYISPCRDKGTSSGTPAPPLTDFLGHSRIGDFDIGAFEVQGQYSMWTGVTSSSWNESSNWSPVGTPGTLNDVAIFNAPHYPEISGTIECNNLIIEPSAGLTVLSGGTLSVDGSLVINSSATNNSGSLINNGSVTGRVIYNRTMNLTNYHYFSSPLVSPTFPTSKTVWLYNEGTGDWDITTACMSGIGYTIEPGVGSMNFTGSLLTSDIVIPASSPYSDVIDVGDGYDRDYADGRNDGANWGGGGWNLLGNPFTSALNVSDFIDQNYSSTPDNSQFDPNYVALYLYNGSTYNYVAKSTGWQNGTYLNEAYIQVGQGFFVLAMNDFATFTFSRSMQGLDTDVELLKTAKVKDRWPGLQLKVKYGEEETLTTIVFNQEMTAGLDPGYDVGLMSSGSDVEIYTTLVHDNGVNFARQALPLTGANKNIIPVGINTERGGKVTFSADVETLRYFKFILEDRATGIFNDMSTSSYTTMLPAKTYGTGRFFIHISAGRGLRQWADQPNLLNVRMWASQSHQVNIEGSVSDKATCQIYNIYGQIIFDTHLTESGFNTFKIPQEIKGVYLVKVTDAGKVYTQKMVFL